MAVQSTLVNTGMTLKYKAGIDALGNDIIKGKKFSNVKVSAVDDDILSIALALGNLMENEVLEIVRSNESLIVNL
jgi:hypothetical protein